MKKIFGFLAHRVVVIAFAILAQLAFLLFILVKFQAKFVYFYAISAVLSFLVVVYILNRNQNPAYKLAWVIPILIFPIFGGIFYLMFGKSKLSQSEHRKMISVAKNVMEYLNDEKTEVMAALEESDPVGACQSRYLAKYAYSPVWNNTETTYLPMGEVKFEHMVEELKKAQHFIFLEYFIVNEGKMWNTILDILTEKAQQGVDVRMIYDDMGCIMTLPYGYDKKLAQRRIKCKIFNPFIPIMSMRFNNRDHRKICVIDGNVGFTGGINLADEYINARVRHGHWKDTAIMLRGDAVWNLTILFLSMWDYLADEKEDFNKFRPDIHAALPENCDGFVQPFADSPLDGECVGETVYLNMINKAQKYIYITTPYLIIDNEMVVALCIAAKNGIDVRIITPHVPDKWYVHAVTRAYYETLIESGVKIYEYTPGFIHAKTYVCDDQYAVVGTINMDYRSLYLHFECGVLLCGGKIIQSIYDDFLLTLEQCEEISLKACREVPPLRRMGRGLLRVFAPLM